MLYMSTMPIAITAVLAWSILVVTSSVPNVDYVLNTPDIAADDVAALIVEL